ncbi:class I SAM-dependent methyltransferase [Paenibacillus psychroresistens]|uniref:Class I SAM-dependent methyltransferase n=1 Tax=Paenibacillus psychroresistens TaxID=1778678 RepID=A0A6B8REB7_9BACL|nr:class I SAM-dependent methyltransferase [Paenibacillus psychroresistens]QGQ93885.1 class I SAM-dependent methyltransferase [Paenibacillus psychroresistens]
MDKVEYKNFYDKVGKLNGWDFSKLQVVSEGEQWDFYSEVTQRCKKSDLLLDIGTGGGEKLLAFTDSAILLVGIDHTNGMIQTANANLQKAMKQNVRFLLMDAEKIEFPSSFFNVVSCRHSSFYAKEVAKVLKKDGVFLTQQVSDNDKFNIKQAFGRGQQFRPEQGTLKEKYLSELAEAGFTDIQSFEYDATEYYKTYEDLVFLLKYTPIVPNFGEFDNDFRILQKFIEENQTEQGIQTNSKRFMIIAKR